MDWSTAAFPLRPVQTPPYSVPVPGAQPVPGESLPRRHPKARNGLLERPAPDIDTMFALVRSSGARFANEPAIGSRQFLGIHKETKTVPKLVDGAVRQVDKEWSFFELSNYTYETYGDYYTTLLQVGAGLRRLGLQRHDRIHVFATTSPQWIALAHGCSAQSMTIVTAYDTLGQDGVRHSLTESGAVAMFTDPHLLAAAAAPLKAAAASVRFLIYNDLSHQPVPPATIDAFCANNPQLRVLSFSELRQLGTDDDGRPSLPPVPPTPDETFCIMYTSGSTGLPKGVPVSHAALIAAVTGLQSVVEESVSHHDRVLAYLPLAHIFELVVENLVLLIGGTLGYGSPRTLTDASMKAGCKGDLRAFGPTILVGVPQVWETVRKGVESGVAAAGPVAQALFQAHLACKSFLVNRGLLVGPLATVAARIDRVVFGKVRASTGGNLRFIVNGASGIAADTKRFLSLVVAPMIGGYGLTETCGNGSLGSPLQYTTTSAIGAMPGAIEVKLVSQPELGYVADPPPGSGEDPHGEIWIRGKPVATEYFNNPAETALAFSPDGWFRTGDVGAFDRNGHIRIVDRLKNLVKMQGGEYIALEKLEAVYRGASTVHNIMVYGDAEHARPVAVVCVNEKALEALAAKNGIAAAPPAAGAEPLHRNPKVRALVLRELLAVGKTAGLTPIELLQGVALVDEEWTPINEFVTATQKVNRRKIKAVYGKEIEATFAGK